MRQPLQFLLLIPAAVAALATTAGAQAQTRGLNAAPDALGGPVWQARFERDASAPTLPGLSSWLLPPATPQTLRLLGDYQFSTLRLGQTGGLRLTGGLLLNQRIGGGGTLAGAIQSAQPYAGVGYASGSLDGRWGFSADLGLAGNGLGPLRLDRQATALGIDGQPRLGPLLRLGMTLSF
jgi:hypothetical protein